MLPEIQFLIGSPLDLPYVALYGSLSTGVVSPPTSTSITVASTLGYKIVFNGSFTVVGGDVTGGTMTGFTVFAGSTKVIVGKGYAADGAALYDAVVGFGSDSDPFFDLLDAGGIRFKGSNYSDQIAGTEFADKLLGRGGDDYLIAIEGDDIVKGGKGDDTLLSGNGFAKMWGNAGSDTFVLQFDPMFAHTAFVRIKDFVSGEDVIGVATFLDGLPPGFLDKNHFHKGKGATSPDHMVIYDKKSGSIYLDPDGNGSETQVLLGKVGGGTKVKAGDFFIGTDGGMFL